MEKTTIMMRGDLKEAIEKQFGKRQISNIINNLLFRELMDKKNKGMFGIDKWLTKKKIKEVREHNDRF